MFKLKAQNVVFWLAAPTLIARYSYNQTIHDKVDTMWRIHLNREKKGLEATANSSGIYANHKQDYNY
jgi:hypothetical protein